MDLFINKASDYTRDYRIAKHYIENKAITLTKITGRSYTEALEYVTRVTGVGGKFELKDPKVKLLVRNKVGDRELKYTTFNQFLKAVEQRKAILSPSLTAYLNPSEKVSQYALSTDKNIKARKVIKKEMFVAQAQGDLVTKNIKNIMQTGRKLTNNGMSGGFCTASTPLFCRSAHSSLTSCCRAATSSTNAFNEKFLAGNRHYWSPEITYEAIASIITHSDYPAITACMNEFGLAYPTVDQTLACIYRSTRRYWTDATSMALVSKFVNNLTDLERAAFMFTGDLYHLRECNPEFVKRFILDLAERTEEEVVGDVNMQDSDARVLALMKVADHVIRLGSKAASTDQGVKNLVKANYVLSVANVERYRSYIRAFLVTPNTPISVAMMPHHVREVVLASDTDSSIFTEQLYIDWIQPDYAKRQERIQLNAAMTFLISQQVVHLLATVSGCIGVAQEHIFRLMMKNEYYFESFVLTNMGKHYFATMAAREGNFYDDPELERKGVHLRNSNVPKEIRDRGDHLIHEILDKSNVNEQFSAVDLLEQIGDIERFIITSIQKGETVFLTKTTVKDKEAYTKPLSNNYYHYLMWEEVFAPKYGAAPALEYIGLKAKLGLDSKTAVQEWLSGLDDQAFADRMRTFLTKYGKDKVTQVVLPADIIMNTGLPPEVIAGINIRKLIMENLGMVYSCMESLGLYWINPNATRLVSDEH